MDKANRTYFFDDRMFTAIYRIIKVLADGHHGNGDEAEGAVGKSKVLGDNLATG